SSTGTFVSCKDYDDDIKDLQEQINSNKDAITALQKLVGEGKWVTSISSIENGFTVTMSDGTTTSITGIKGADGKNGTEWTIGEDGFWYKDGEKTASQAVAKDGEDGKAGATAPSPKISADGFWVVYEWDADKGEFVEKTTEISAQGTGAYVVKKDGVYVLHIADETGAFQDVTLPATSDSFVVEALAPIVNVKFQTAKWQPAAKNTTEKAKKAYKALTEKFTDLTGIAANATVKQGGELPILVNPANVELTDKFDFSLQLAKGKVLDIALSNPVKGIADDWKVKNGVMSRAAKTEDCLWTLDVEPAYDEKDKKYATTESEEASLVIENEKGTVVKTAFAYNVSANEVKADVTVQAGTVTYAPTIDLTAVDAKTEKAGIIYANEYKGKAIVKLRDQLNIEQYGLSLDGNVLTIANMPANVSSITVKLNVIALGLNGSAIDQDIDVTVNQDIQVAGGLEDKNVTLSTEKVGAAYTQNILWNVADFQFTTATQKNAFFKAAKTMQVYLLDENGEKPETATYTYSTKDSNLNQYKSDGKATATSYSDFAKFGFSLDAATYIPGTYAIEFEAKDGATTIVKSEATMIVSNPKAEDIFKLVPDFTTAGVLQVIGDYASVPNKVVYNLGDGILVPDFADNTSVTYIDLDHKAWVDAMGANTEMGAEDWITNNQLNVYQNAWKGANTPDNQYMLNKDRNIRATYKLYGNAENTINYDFKVIVKSSVYTKDGSNVTVKAITGNFGKTVDMTSNISAVYALGINKGKALTLFGNAGGSTQKDVTDYNAPEKDAAGKYVVDANATPIEIAKADLIKFGMTVDAYTALKDEKFFLTVANNDVTVGSETSTLMGWETIMTEVNKYYTYNNGVWGDKSGLTADEKAARDASAEVALFKAYNAKLAYATKKETVTTDEKKASDEIKSVEFAWDDAKLADKFVSSVATDGAIADGKFTAKAESDIKASDLVNGKAELKVNMKVTDKWGMVMTKTYTVTLTKK
ncbi:PL29 family lyase N-terminal domain-containing protein, partial [uncultured Phocaeicola sp.]|uniref:PL29 family lyase N-terminal domain-containing protein n=1 Tax=uncultured Phocaeicola sp. TaxID=990718 RepID=UPI0026027658